MPGSTERTRSLRQRVVSKSTEWGNYVQPVEGCMERARYFTASYKETEGEPEVIRRARATAKTLDNMTIYIKDGELLVGNMASRPHKMCLYPDGGFKSSVSWLLMDKKTFKLSQEDTGYIEDKREYLTPAEKEELRAMGEYWLPRNLEGRVRRLLTAEEQRLADANTHFQSTTFKDNQSSPVPDWEFWLKNGFNGVIAMIEAKKAELDKILHRGPSGPAIKEAIPRYDQYEAMLISLQAMVRFARRFSELAAAAAARTEDPVRRAELEEISRVCRRVAGEPPATFRGALQLVWFGHIAIYAIERECKGSAARVDQLFWPYYKHDVIDTGRITREQALELLECQRILYSEIGKLGSAVWRDQQQGAGEVLIWTIGGQKRDGSDACNELTNLYIQAAINVRTNQPSLAFHWHPHVTEEAMRYVAAGVRAGLGYPSIMNDLQAIPSLMSFGIPLEEARDWANVLCMSPGVVGRAGTRVRNPWSLLAQKCFELALCDGYDYYWTKSQLGPHTGDARQFTYDDLVAAYRAQVRAAAEVASRIRDITRTVEALYFPAPLLSSTFAGCIERGIDGMVWDEYPNPWVNTLGLVDVADSLAAIKKLIFEEKRYTMDQLLAALQANWEGYEKMRQDFINEAPKFGNDDDYVDLIAREVFDITVDEVGRNLNYSGGSYKPLPQALAGFVSFGRKTGALPNGRQAGEPISDGGISPVAGCDKKGPTAVLNSVAKINHLRLKQCLLNQRLAPASLKGEKGINLFNNYVRTLCQMGISHVQFNVVDTAVLRAAQKEPEKYSDLVVRIAGYSAYFTELNRVTQDAVIARTEQMLA